MSFINTKKIFIIITGSLLFSFFLISGAIAQQQKVHEKSLSVITVGSGCPGGFTTNRAEAMTVIQNKGKYIVLDCGYTSLMKLMQQKFPLKNIDTIMFTHLHADHSSDFINLLLWRYAYGGRELNLIGTPRTGEYYKFVTSFYKDDMMYRSMVFDTKTLIGFFKGVNVRELKGNNSFNIGDIKVESTPGIHTMYDLAYKFTIDGATIVVTGDTSYSKTVSEFAKNADLVVFDGSFILWALNPPKVDAAWDPSKMLARTYDDKTYDQYKPEKYAGNMQVESHCNYWDIIKASAEMNPKKLVLTHLFADGAMGKPDPQTPELKAKVTDDLKKAGFTGEVFFAVDGLEVAVK
jgi:ribonuclease BN (tRNA processing enzyme)